MAPLRTSIRSIAEPSVITGYNSTSATAIKQHTSATRLSESGKSRSTQARKKACEYCYRVHKRCQGTFPCDRCIKAGCAAECTEHKRQRHARKDAVTPSRATVISSLRPTITGTANAHNHSSLPVELDIEPAIARSPSALPSPASHAVLPDLRTTLLTSHVPHVDTISSPSLTDSSTMTDENTSPIDDALDACLTRLTSEQWMSDTAVCAWDTLAQQEVGPAVSQVLCGDPELWSFIETLISSTVHDPQPVSPGFLT